MPTLPSMTSGLDEALALAPGHRHDQTCRHFGGLAQSQHHFGNTAAQVAPQVKARASGQVLELDAAQLVQRFVLAELAGLEPA